MLSNEQIKAVKISQRKAGLDDAAYRLLLANVAGVTSCKDLDNTGFEDVMATLEDIHGDGEKWRGVVANRGRWANPRLVHKIHALFAEYQELSQDLPESEQLKLPGLVGRLSNGYTRDPNRMKPWQAWNLVEALKKILARLQESAPEPVATGQPSDDCPF